MKLLHKNFLYTTIITSILAILVLGYFVIMFPSLYVDYMSEENYNAIVKQHKSYLKDGNYENVSVKNPACITMEIPFSNDSIIITGKSFQATITPSTAEMKKLLAEIKQYGKSQIKNFQGEELDEEKFEKETTDKLSEWKEELQRQTDFLKEMPFEIKASTDSSDFSGNYKDESTQIHFLSDDTLIIEAGIQDGENNYTNYMGMTFDSDRIVLSFLSAMTPQMNEITPIVVHSLPMLIAVIILFALLVSYLYTNGIVEPIIRLANHTEAVKKSGTLSNAVLPVKGKDEISMLVRTLNELYEELNKNNRKLEENNKILEDKNKRQELFLKSSSHQLKTPIAAALLLVDGMINQIGKYQDTDVYLPEVKKQLLSMRKIVEDILYLSRREENVSKEMVDIKLILENLLSVHQIALAEGRHPLITEYSENCFVTTDPGLLSKILDNLIINAIVHSQEEATIEVLVKPGKIEIFNYPAHIPEELMPDMYEPFVSGNGKGHGLGLYIVAYYANIIGAVIQISNKENGVLAEVTLEAAVTED